MDIYRSAYRHGVTEADIRHALRNAVRVFPTDDDGVTMFVGPARVGALLEIGTIEVGDETVVVHAMAARYRYLR